jgi:hypothetical protein
VALWEGTLFCIQNRRNHSALSTQAGGLGYYGSVLAATWPGLNAEARVGRELHDLDRQHFYLCWYSGTFGIGLAMSVCSSCLCLESDLAAT